MKFFRDVYILFRRALQITLRNPVWLFFGMFQPLCFLFFFAPLLEKLVLQPGMEGNALSIYTPGLLVMTALFSTSFVGFSLIDDVRSGVIERFQVTPVSRAAIIIARSLRDMLMLTVQSLFLVALAWAMGLSAPLSGVLLSFGLILLIGMTMSCCSYTIALIVKSEDALAPILNFFILPLQLLAGITLPLSLAPNWLQTVASFNPLSHAVTGARALFAGVIDFSVLMGFLCVGIACVLALIWSLMTISKTAE
jgi:ABC-2 type transport system permease protein